MSYETVFSICNMAVLPGWLLLAILPRWKWTARLITSVIIPALLGLVYLYLVITQLGREVLPLGDSLFVDAGLVSSLCTRQPARIQLHQLQRDSGDVH